MNTSKTLLTLALALTAAAPAFAQEAVQDLPTQYRSQLSRVEVRQALAQTTTQAPGADITHLGEATQFAVPMGPVLSRAQVVAETREALRLGVVGRSERNVFATAAELESIRQAGLRAVPMTMAAR